MIQNTAFTVFLACAFDKGISFLSLFFFLPRRKSDASSNEWRIFRVLCDLLNFVSIWQHTAPWVYSYTVIFSRRYSIPTCIYTPQLHDDDDEMCVMWYISLTVTCFFLLCVCAYVWFFFERFWTFIHFWYTRIHHSWQLNRFVFLWCLFLFTGHEMELRDREAKKQSTMHKHIYIE